MTETPTSEKPEEAGASVKPRSSGLMALPGEIVAAFRKDVVGWVSKSLLAALVAAGGLYGAKMLDLAKEARNQRLNISNTVAFEQARRDVGAGAVWAVPFRNRGDSSQYIAVWASEEQAPCEPETDLKCLRMLGSLRLNLLVGDGQFYEVKPIAASAYGNLFMQPAVDSAAPDKAWPENQVYFGVTDWDHDGRREVLSIANTLGTSATHFVAINLYDVAAGKSALLVVTHSRSTVSRKFDNADDPALRSWLNARYEEWLGPEGRDCVRALDGVLGCTPSASAAKDTSPEDAALEANYQFETALVDDWNKVNGFNFTTGQLRLTVRQGAPAGQPCMRDGNLAWYNQFKGPLLVHDVVKGKTAAFYVQDGDHHREIRRIFLGKRYVWLGLAVGRNELLAIDRVTMKAEGVHVEEWSNGIPSPYETGAVLAPEGTKDMQLSELDLTDGRLTYNGQPLTLMTEAGLVDQSLEFASPKGCRETDPATF
ncbi:hypothetical protein [Caulobacter sp.]|uniref:hypothetical protein n=1 Tax=Caulobacter sp. TaxID=78 RepID=UPI001B2CDF59|nr:hypothetical protein [Caulobacter sp.]MBO9546665.1 hypothetical protein [Caulobacter sp.]